MMNTQRNTLSGSNGSFEQSEIGLFELSDTGTVLYCRTGANGQLKETSVGAVGRNFFDEIAPFANTEELRLRLNRFVKSDCATEKFVFACQIENQIVPAKIMLVRVAEQSGSERGKTTIVDIRKI